MAPDGAEPVADADAAAQPLQSGEGAVAGEQRDERPRGERGERGEGRRDGGRRERGDRGERPERGPRDGDRQEPTMEGEALAGAAGSVGAVNESAHAELPPGADPVLESHTHYDQGRPEGGAEGEGRRRSRDRYGRDRRERGERSDRPSEAIVATGAEVSPAEQEVFAGHQPLPVEHHAGGSGSARAEQAPAPAAKGGHVPRVQPFQLPVDDLKNVAEGSGLQWVMSDADKIAQAQAAMAAEPQPMRVPRERPPAVVVDEGPLVLVETKRDLRNMPLPF
jgi:ribonuclease E